MMIPFVISRSRSATDARPRPAARAVLVVAAAAVQSLAAAVLAGDAWPTYRFDAARSGWSDAALPESPVLRWRWQSPLPPQPAWPAPADGNLLQNLRKLNRWDTSDHAFHVAIAGGKVLFGSTVDDSVHCLALQDGREVWRHETGGPVRMPPTIHSADVRGPDEACKGGAVFAASDDGFLRCLALDDGREVWRYRPGPEDRHLPGNGRLISRWPIRGGPIVQDGNLIVAAGVFPLEGVFVAALDPATGTVRWQRAIDGVAHGPLVATPEKVFVTALRANPTAYEIATGKPVEGAGGTGAVALVRDGALITGPAEAGPLHGVDPVVQQALVVRDGFQCVTRGGRLAAASDKMLAAFDPGPAMRWKVERGETFALIAAGETLVVGGRDEVRGYDADTGRELWRVPVEGAAIGLAAVDGVLVVSTDRGDVLAFAAEQGGAPAAAPALAPVAAASSPRVEAAAETLAKVATDPGGYAAVFGAEAVDLAAAVARRTALHAVGFAGGDGEAVKTSRARLATAGLLGHRVTLESAADGTARYEAGVFDLVVVNPSSTDPGIDAREARRLAVPGRGIVALVAAAGDSVGEPWMEVFRDGSALPAVGGVRLWRVGPRAGTGQWTHPFADSGNTACSTDDLVKPPFEMQWFGPPGPEAIVDRHNRTSPPLFSDGRLFVAARDAVVAVDALNGASLWRRPLEGSSRLAVSKNCGHMVVDSRFLFAAVRDQCAVLRVDSGAEERRLRIPEVDSPPPPPTGWEWGYLAVSDGVLVGSRSEFEKVRLDLAANSWERGYLDNSPLVTSDMLFAHDAAAGRLVWTAPLVDRVVMNTTLAVSGGKVFGLEARRPEAAKIPGGRARLGDLLAEPGELVARDLASGKAVWRQTLAIAPQHSIFTVATAGTVLLAFSRNEGATLVCHLQAFSAEDGRPLWDVAEVTGLPVGGSHGEQEQHPLVANGTVFFKTFTCDLATGKTSRTWKLPMGGCGALSASNHCTFFRASTAWFADLTTAAGAPLTGVTRPGCWLNMLPAGGLLLAPESSAGCTCQYPIQTSLAMRPLAEPAPQIMLVAADGSRVPVGDLEFVGRIRVAAESAGVGSEVRYSTAEGGWPTPASTVASAPVVFSDSGMLRARAFSASGRSGLASRRFTRIDTPRLVTASRQFVTTARIVFADLPGDAVIRYRTDGTTPTAGDAQYVEPFELAADAELVAAYFVDGEPAGPELRASFRKVSGRQAADVGEVVPGLTYDYFEGEGWKKLPDCDALVPIRSGTVPRFVVPAHRPDGFAVRYRGYIRIPEDGMYRFFLRSDDGSVLRVAGEPIVDNDGIHDARRERSGEMPLAAGLHAIEVRYFDVAAGEVLQVGCAGPGFGKREIPGEWLARPAAPTAPETSAR